jgi:hypothetical protein
MAVRLGKELPGRPTRPATSSRCRASPPSATAFGTSARRLSGRRSSRGLGVVPRLASQPVSPDVGLGWRTGDVWWESFGGRSGTFRSGLFGAEALLAGQVGPPSRRAPGAGASWERSRPRTSRRVSRAAPRWSRRRWTPRSKGASTGRRPAPCSPRPPLADETAGDRVGPEKAEDKVDDAGQNGVQVTYQGERGAREHYRHARPQHLRPAESVSEPPIHAELNVPARDRRLPGSPRHALSPERRGPRRRDSASCRRAVHSRDGPTDHADPWSPARVETVQSCSPVSSTGVPFRHPRLASSSLPPPKLRLAPRQEGAQGLL